MDTGILTLFMKATVVAKVVMLLLICMSLGSWTLIIHKWLTLTRARKKAREGLVRFTNARDLREAVQSLGADAASPLYHVAQQGVAEFNRLKEAGNSGEVVADNVRRSLRQGVSEAMERLGSALSFLATAANTAPFIGLFGTVWGIMYSFHQIAQLKTASLAAVAPGISEALIATAVGLFVAIPATVGYNTFLGVMQNIEAELVNFAGVFLNRVQRELNSYANARAQAESAAENRIDRAAARQAAQQPAPQAGRSASQQASFHEPGAYAGGYGPANGHANAYAAPDGQARPAPAYAAPAAQAMAAQPAYAQAAPAYARQSAPQARAVKEP